MSNRAKRAERGKGVRSGEPLRQAISCSTAPNAKRVPGGERHSSPQAPSRARSSLPKTVTSGTGTRGSSGGFRIQNALTITTGKPATEPATTGPPERKCLRPSRPQAAPELYYPEFLFPGRLAEVAESLHN